MGAGRIEHSGAAGGASAAIRDKEREQDLVRARAREHAPGTHARTHARVHTRPFTPIKGNRGGTREQENEENGNGVTSKNTKLRDASTTRGIRRIRKLQ